MKIIQPIILFDEVFSFIDIIKINLCQCFTGHHINPLTCRELFIVLDIKTWFVWYYFSPTFAFSPTSNIDVLSTIDNISIETHWILILYSGMEDDHRLPCIPSQSSIASLHYKENGQDVFCQILDQSIRL